MAAKKKTPAKKTAPPRPAVRKVIRKAVPKKITPIMRSVQAPPEPETPLIVTLVIPSAAPLMVSHADIARRAYEIWEWKVRFAHDAARNWAEAEAAIRAELGEV
jgi:hypothetical protein